MDYSGFGLTWKDWKGKDISNFNFRAVNLVSYLNTKIICYEGGYDLHALNDL